jgi:alpha-glucosidase
LLPRKGYGFFQTQHLAAGGSQEKLMTVARAFRDRHLPCDTLIIDFEWGDGIGENGPIEWGHSLDWAPAYRTPLTPAEMVTELRRMHFDVMLIHHSVPAFENRCDRGWTQKVYPCGQWWKALQEKLDMGVVGTWQDTRGNEVTDSYLYLEQEALYKRRITFMGCRQMFDTRSWDGWGKHVPTDQLIGSRRYPFDWTCDCHNTWEELAWQVEAIVNRHGSMKAVTYITNDTSAANWRIQARWNQFIAFNSVARSHNQKPWQGASNLKAWLASLSWDSADGKSAVAVNDIMPVDRGQPTAENSIRRHLMLRYRLLPYVYATAHVNWLTGMPICRPLLLAFPNDPGCNDDQWPRQYLFGPNLMVAPVCADVNEMQIYFPGTQPWRCWWDGRVYEGGSTVAYDVSDIERLPLFVRSGAIIPMLRDQIEWIEPRSAGEALEIRVYPGDSGEFNLYEDDGESLEYRAGQVGRTRLTFETVGREWKFTIGPLEGDFAGKPERRNIDLVFIGQGAPQEVQISGSESPPWSWNADACELRVPFAASTGEEKVVSVKTQHQE